MSKTISLNMIQNDYPDLYGWITSITRYDDVDQFIKGECDLSSDDESIRIKLWTHEHEYAIRARLPSEGDAGYLGCIASNRKPRAGEDWTRGNDLPDGGYNINTWKAIVNGILAYELSKIAVSPPQQPVDEVELTSGAGVSTEG